MGACKSLPDDHALGCAQLADFCAHCDFDETVGVRVPESANLADMVTTPLCGLCLCVELEVLHVGKELAWSNFLVAH